METLVKHTKGPWKVGTGWIYAGNKPKGARSICEIPAYPWGNTEANARLIAAAPELLEACQAVLTRLDLEPTDAIFPFGNAGHAPRRHCQGYELALSITPGACTGRGFGLMRISVDVSGCGTVRFMAN